MKKSNLFAVAMALAVVFSVLPGGVTFAQATKAQGGNALRISPVRQDVTISPGASKTLELVLDNPSDKPAAFQAVINDFVANKDESGTPALILDKNVPDNKHGLKQYVSDVPDVTLQGNERKTVTVNIAIPRDAAGGGYYGAVRFVPKGSSDGNTVSLAASVGSLILVRVPGNVSEQLRIESMNVRQGDKASNLFTSGSGLKVVTRFENTGNVQTAPFGKLIVKRFGKVIDTKEVNNTEPRSTALPDSIRRFETDIANTSQFGKYTVEGNFGFGSSSQSLSGKVTFYVVPAGYIIGALIVLALIVFGAYRVFKTKPLPYGRKKR